jgi:hypothetical protein
MMINLLHWLLGEKGTDEFIRVHGKHADLDFHFVQATIAEYKLGAFDIKESDDECE